MLDCCRTCSDGVLKKLHVQFQSFGFSCILVLDCCHSHTRADIDEELVVEDSQGNSHHIPLMLESDAKARLRRSNSGPLGSRTEHRNRSVPASAPTEKPNIPNHSFLCGWETNERKQVITQPAECANLCEYRDHFQAAKF